jgi:hypothetical protein
MPLCVFHCSCYYLKHTALYFVKYSSFWKLSKVGNVDDKWHWSKSPFFKKLLSENICAWYIYIYIHTHTHSEMSVTKSCGWRNYIRYNEILLHWNTLKISHRCLHRRFCRAAAIESNESKAPLRARLHWSIRVARRLNSGPNPKLKMFTLSLVISIPFNIDCDERAGECGYVLSIFIF